MIVSLNGRSVTPHSINGYEISKSCMSYITDLTQGEDYPSYITGFPRYANLNCKTIKRKLKKFAL